MATISPIQRHADRVPVDPPVDLRAGPTSLPTPLTSFVGRADEIVAVSTLLDDAETRILTLMGSGGVGKTRLGNEVARRLEHAFADGVTWVPLAPVRDPGMVLATVAQSIGVQHHGDRPLIDVLVLRLRDRHTLLVLDNFEHLLAETPAWLVPLLERCPRLKVLVTSRSPLDIGGERRFLVTPLPLPEPKTVQDIDSAASVALFVQRAHAVQPGFTLTPANSDSIGEICRRVDGLPLAIELAAARMNVLSPNQIVARLTDRFRLLSGGRRDVSQRHQSMRDAIAWSYDLLAPDEQRLFRQLSVFVGGFTLEAAEAIGAPDGIDVVAIVASLVDKSLLRRMQDGQGEPRFLMLETIREFGLEHLADVGEEESMRDRHAAWCLALARQANPYDATGQLPWLDGLDAEHGNVLAAAHWLDGTDRPNELTELVTQLRWFWYLTGRESEGLAWFQRVLAQHPDPSDRAHIDALIFAGHLAEKLGRTDAVRLLDQAVVAAAATDDRLRTAEATLNRAIMAEDHGDYDTAAAGLLTARTLYEQLGHAARMIVVDYHLGAVTYGKGDVVRAAPMIEGAREAAEAIGDPIMPTVCRNLLTLIACERRDVEVAAAHLRDILADPASVLQHDRPLVLSIAAVFASAVGSHQRGARLLGAAASSEFLVMLPERAAFERAATEARRALGDAAFPREWEAGRRLRPDQITAEIERLLADGDIETAPDPRGTQPASGLTRREREVLRLMANGMTNQQIADTLFNSRNTVANHVAHILDKLDVDSRTAAVSFAIRHHLV